MFLQFIVSYLCTLLAIGTLLYPMPSLGVMHLSYCPGRGTHKRINDTIVGVCIFVFQFYATTCGHLLRAQTVQTFCERMKRIILDKALS